MTTNCPGFEAKNLLPNTVSVLIIEDRPKIAETLAQVLNANLANREAPNDLLIRQRRCFSEGMAAMKECPADLVFVQLALPDAWGIRNYDRLKGEYPKAEIGVLIRQSTPSLSAELKLRSPSAIIETPDLLSSGESSTRFGRLFNLL